MRTLPLLGLVAIALAIAACGGGGGGADGGPPPTTNLVSGTVGGQSFAIAQGLSVTVELSPGTTGAFVELSSSADGCGSAGAFVEHAGEQIVIVILADVTATTATAPTAPGTYTITTADLGTDTGSDVPPRAARITTAVLDATCAAQTTSAIATSGTVSLAAVAGDVFSGTFDVTMMTDSATTDHITGSFAPDACPALATLATGGVTPPCM